MLQSNRQWLCREPETMSQTKQAVTNSFKIKLICPSSCWNIYILSTRRVTGGLKKEAYCFSSQNTMRSLYTLELLKISRVTPRLPSKPTPVLPLVLDDTWVQMCFGEVYLWGAKDWKEALVHARQAFYAKLYPLLFCCRLSLCSPGWSHTSISPVSASWVLRSQGCTTPGWGIGFLQNVLGYLFFFWKTLLFCVRLFVCVCGGAVQHMLAVSWRPADVEFPGTGVMNRTWVFCMNKCTTFPAPFWANGSLRGDNGLSTHSDHRVALGLVLGLRCVWYQCEVRVFRPPDKLERILPFLGFRNLLALESEACHTGRMDGSGII